MNQKSKSSSDVINAAPDGLDMNEFRHQAHKWYTDLGYLPNFVLDTIFSNIYITCKNVKSVESRVFLKEKHIEFTLFTSIWPLLFNSKRKLIISNIYNIMYNILQGWTFNIIFKRYGKKVL